MGEAVAEDPSIGSPSGSSAPPLRFGILGALEAHTGARALRLGPLKQRIVLGLLLCRANRVVSVDAFCDALWSGRPPRTAHKNLQVYVSALRKELRGCGDRSDDEGQALIRRPPGYLIQVRSEQLDLLRFEELARGGRLAVRGGDLTHAAHLLGTAVSMWRGPALSDLASVPALANEAEQLEERYLTVYEDWCQAELALGHHAQHVDDIDGLARRHPYRERLRHAQMLALYQSGRQTEALAQFEAMRQMLVRDLGMQPSPVLARLYEAILSGDAALDPSPAPQARPIVIRHDRTQLPADLADFTGRAAQVRRLTERVGSPAANPVTVITGPPGVGKTALAVHGAHQVAERFPDGRLLVRLRTPQGRPRPAAEVLVELLRRIGVSGQLPRGPQERAALYRTHLAELRMLVVLDGAFDEAQVRPMLPGAGESRAVVTSRRRLLGLEAAEHLDLPPMDEPEALDLLGRLIGAERAAAEPVTARLLVETCGLLPLPVRIVGANLAGLSHLTLAHYARRLADERQLLDELTAGDLRVRPRLESCYQDLHPHDRATLRRIGLLPDQPFGLREAAIALGTALPAAEKALESLMAAHLLLVHAWSTDGPCYRLPVPFRAYARERARAEDPVPPQLSPVTPAAAPAAIPHRHSALS
ncbi:BTAD domain-containing putative transcriptional regulator [Streptomyces polygonati]|uniref:BTAD domain-containing putative transcriptional regulator n=1 Tax=Streptomyces polygonati TaxID=1617087 RepID=A0ABV8HM06_9ACTN